MLNRYASLRQGLVGAWCPSLGASGFRLIDRSGYNNHGTLTNMDPGTDWVPSAEKGGRMALDFDGVNDYVASVVNSQISGNVPLTCCMWILWKATQLDFRIPFGIGTDTVGGTRGYYIWRSNSGFVRSEFGSSTGAAISPTTSENFKWYSVVGRYNGSTNQLYINGLLVASTSYSVANITGNKLRLGAISDSNNIENYFTNCQLDDVRIDNRALTPSEISLIYTGGRGVGLMPERIKHRRKISAAATNRRRRIIIGASS